jgi:glycosyltransferase involved in cell wall biosynthesis
VPAFWQSAGRADARRRLDVPESATLVSYIGTIGMAHGLRAVLDAAARLLGDARDVRFLIVGDGAELPQLRAAVADRRLTNVTFTGLVPREEIPSLHAASDIALVTLRRSDLFKTVLPSKMFEAMAAGRPIVLGVEGEAREILREAGAGIAVTPDDVEAMVSAIRRLADDAALRRRLGRSGGEYVAREFSRQAWARKYLDILGGVAEGAPGRAGLEAAPRRVTSSLRG